MIAYSHVMQKLMNDVQKIALSQATVLITGESGTGKEIIAQAIHQHSLRAKEVFIKVNCAAIPASLLESEFFGHEKGAFTGALQRRLGRFELAHRGTLLLDEVSEIPIELQSKLLRAIQEMEFERVGSTTPVRVDVRLIATSNRQMKEAIELKQFREDLYYRLNVIPIHLPPLREHRDDIVPLVESFLERLCKENQRTCPHVSDDAKQALQAYGWPGNIRELANVVERALILHPVDILLPCHFDLGCEKPEACPVGTSLQEMEKTLILQTLKAHGNHRTKTAQVLGISVRTLRNKLQSYMQTS